jgi:hypothetical protein
MTIKRAGNLVRGDVVDLTDIKPNSYPLRTVDHIEWNQYGQVRVHWVEPLGYYNTLPADKELTIR